MLNNLQSSINNHKSRGARPGNTNAYRHGLYSGRSKAGLASIHNNLASLRRQAGKYTPTSPVLIKAACQTFDQIAKCVATSASTGESLPALNLLGSSVNFLDWMYSRDYRQSQGRRDLEFVAPRAMDLIQLHFSDYSITRDADLPFDPRPASSGHAQPSTSSPVGIVDPQSSHSFLESQIKVDQNSARSSGRSFLKPPTFLSDEQWAILEPMLPQPNEGDTLAKACMEPSISSPNGACPQPARRGRPSTEPRLLLDAIFWKLSTASPWSDLSRSFPPAPTCRRYYRRLFKSGRLATIYHHLFHHLRRQGVRLSKLVGQDCFVTLPRQRLALRPDLSVTWQLQTALLFMQVASQVLRRRRREGLRDDRRMVPTWKLPRRPSRPSTSSIPSSDSPILASLISMIASLKHKPSASHLPTSPP